MDSGEFIGPSSRVKVPKTIKILNFGLIELRLFFGKKPIGGF